MTDQIILVVGHGSRLPEAVAQFLEFSEALSTHLGRAVRHCFLELADPDLAAGLTGAAQSAGPGGQVIVLPLFLGPGGHQKNDVASAIQWARQQFPGIDFRYGAPLGSHAHLVELLDLRVQQCLQAATEPLPLSETIVLVLGRGSSDPDSNGDVAKMARLLFENRPYRAVEYAYQAAARPTVEESLRRCRMLGARQVVLAPFILFTGRVDNFMRAASQRAADELGLRILHADYLGLHPLLLAVVQQRLQEALAGTAAMTCDLCKYRFPLAGYEQQVGRPQTSHHLHGGSAHSHDHHHQDHHDHDHDHDHEPDHHH
ncbi:MAG: sirohydrochlorin chelatase [Chloroflexota bacterium]